MVTKRKESALKSVIWRIMGVGVLGLITYLVTGSWFQTTAITVIHHVTFLFVYYFHERVWLRVRCLDDYRKTRRVVKALTYEVILGHLILGTITYLITKSWLSTSLVALLYIENKLWLYVVYDLVWEKVNGNVR